MMQKAHNGGGGPHLFSMIKDSFVAVTLEDSQEGRQFGTSVFSNFRCYSTLLMAMKEENTLAQYMCLYVLPSTARISFMM